MDILIILSILILLFFFLKNVLNFLFSMENYNIHKKRLKQLRFQRKEEKDITEIIDAVTKPVIVHIFSRFKPRNSEQIKNDLKMAKWDKYFTPIQYQSFNLLTKVIGILFILIFNKIALPLTIAGIVLVFGPNFFLKNTLNNRKSKLMTDFPDFIRITEGYLTANFPFSKAVSESIKYVGDEWKPILQNFVVECEVKSIDDALESLKNEVDLFEVKEFVALVRLVLTQGGDAKESFSSQADKIREMQRDLIAVKIGRRQMMGIIIQAPLLLCNIITFGLPTIASMMNFTSM